jgi:predicted alpha/beta superfamily hydrolase
MKKIMIILVLLIFGLTSCEQQPIDDPIEVENPLMASDFLMAESVSADFTVSLNINGIMISWESDNAAIMIDGNKATVTRMQEDTTVTLTANYVYEEESFSQAFDVVVLGVEPVIEPTITIVTFVIELPQPLSEGQYLSMGSNLNSWNPGNLNYFAEKMTDTTYQFVLALETIPEVIEYKWTIQEGINVNVWSQVEKTLTGGEIENRTVVVTEGVDITVNDTIAKFATNTTGPNISVVGNLDIITNFEIPQIDIHDKTIRVWTPSTYDAKDDTVRYPVIYMHDGQNLFDTATSFAGEWEIDETIEDFIERNLHNGAIVVGIDNSGSYRQNTYTPEWDGPGTGFADEYLDYFPSNEVYGERYGRFIVETLKPYIDANYNTLTDRVNTSIAGSSMGGLISFYIGLKYMDTFGSIGIFSPAFQVPTETGRHNFIDSLDFSGNQLPRVYIDGGSLEGSFSDYVGIVANELYEAGLPKENIYTMIGANQGHNEAAWRNRFPDAFLWMFGTENGNYVPSD